MIFYILFFPKHAVEILIEAFFPCGIKFQSVADFDGEQRCCQKC